MLSYSGLVNYGKATLPSVESWSTNNNIIRDPPRAVMTRRKDRVGDTSQILATLAESDDRFCEAINYYARGVNPMVSVTYGEGQTKQTTSDRGQAFLPYRVVRDGAFRPPIQRQEDLLPLSRLPRNWTTVEPRPFEVDYTKRMFDCGTAETTQQVKNELLKKACETRQIIAADPDLTAPAVTTQQVKNELLKKACETRQIIAADPDLTAPAVKYMLKDPLAPGTMSNPSDTRFDLIAERPPIVLGETRPNASGRTNAFVVNEIPIVMNNVNLDRNHPLAVGFTNKSGPIFDVRLTEAEYDRLLPRAQRGHYEGRPSIPAIAFSTNMIPKLRVR